MSQAVYQAVGTAANGTTGAVTPTLPAHAAGDLLVLVATGDNTNFGTDPAGYTPRGLVSGSAVKLAVWTKIAASGAEGNPTITPTGANHTFAQVITFRNAHATVPVHCKAEGSANTNSVVAALGIDTLIDRAAILQIVAFGADSAGPLASAEANATLTNFAERYDGGTLDGNGGGLIMYTGEKAAAGAVAQTTFTLSASTSVACMTLVISPIADKVIANSVTIAGSPAANGGNVRALDVTQPAASSLCTAVVTTGGTGAFSILSPYTDHTYQAVFDNGASYGASAPSLAV